jgi:MFS family permease
MEILNALLRALLALVLAVLLLQIALRIGRKLFRFPVPAVLGRVLDSDLRRWMYPSANVIERSGIREGMKVLEVGWAITPSLALLLVVLAPLALSGGVLNTVVNSALSKSVDPLEVGGALGLSASLESLTRVVSPSLGGVLLEQVGAWAPGVFGALIMAWLVAFSWRQLPFARESAAL